MVTQKVKPEELVRPQVRTLKAYESKPVPDAVKLDANENPFPWPSGMRERLFQEQLELNRYPDGGATDLKKGIAGYSGIVSEGILTGNGSDELIQLIMTTFGGENTAVVLHPPTFSMYWAAAKVTGTDIIEVPLLMNGTEISLDVEGILEAALRPEAHIIILCNPNNPTGSLYPREDILKIVRESGKIVVVDEAYVEFSGESVLDQIGALPNLLVMRTFSKAFGMAALRLGYLLGQPATIELLNRARQPFNVNVLTQRAGTIALEYLEEYSDQVHVLIEETRKLYEGLAWGYHSLLFFRFLVGFGLGGQLPVAVTLVSEFTPAKHRGKFLVLLESFWALGWLLAAVISYLIIPHYGWQLAFFIGALPALYVFYLWRQIPESPRYLEERGRAVEAEAVYQRILAAGGGIGDRVQDAAMPPNPEISDVGAAAEDKRVGLTEKTAGRVTIAELFSRQFLRKTVFLWLLWFGIVYSYYGIFTWLPSLLALKGFSLTKSFSYVIIMTLAQIPGYFSAAYFVDRIGRKPTLAVYLLGTALSAYFFGQSSSVATILIMGSLMSFFNLGAWGILYTYTPELYPTRTRATGAGWAAGFGRIGGILAPIVVGRMLGSQLTTQTVFLMFAGVLLLVVLNVLVLGEETKGRPLN